MRYSICVLVVGFAMDMVFGDPPGLPHPIVGIGRIIAILERLLRRFFPCTAIGERTAGCVLWVVTAGVSFAVPWSILLILGRVNPYLRLAAECIMCWQILAVKSLKDASRKVYDALCKERGSAASLEAARRAVAEIVGRDTARLDEAGVIRAAVETVAENTSDGVISPLFYLAIGGAPLGFFYKAVNTMDSMLGYIDPPYKNIGLIPAKMDDALNFIPARLTALLMLIAGRLLGMDAKGGWRIFRRDRYRHASPNSAQTEAVCAGLLGVQLAGDAWYRGILHRKETIGDPVRAIEAEDILRANRLLYLTSVLALALCAAVKILLHF